MNKHSKSLFVSLLIHSLLLGVVFYAYTTATAYVGKTKEKRVCIKLGTIQEVAAKKSEIVSKTATTTDKKVIEKKKVVKKPVKKVKKKPIKKKKKPVKKKVPQKVIPPEPKQLEIVEEEKISEVTTGKKELCSKMAKKEEACTNDSKATTTQQKASAKEVYINQHLQEIARLLQENLYYPRRARKRGIEGKVLVKFTLQKNAEVVDVEVVSSSNSILSRGAMKTLENLSGQFPNPDEKLILTVPISYRLSQ